MNLTMNATIILLSLRACNFVLKLLHRVEPGVRVWSKLRLKLGVDKVPSLFAIKNKNLTQWKKKWKQCL